MAEIEKNALRTVTVLDEGEVSDFNRVNYVRVGERCDGQRRD